MVANAGDGTGLSQDVEGVGLVTPPRDVVALVSAIVTLLEDSDLYLHLSTAARLRAEERWNKQEILAPILKTAGKASSA